VALLVLTSVRTYCLLVLIIRWHTRLTCVLYVFADKNNCPKGNGQSAPASICTGAHTLLHLTKQSSAYLENIWGWVADHDIDSGKESAQINVYNARGLRVESAGPVWLYGTAFEHSSLYQYSFMGAQNIFMGAIQTETAYYQPAPSTTPFAPSSSFNDPVFCNDDPRCAMSLAMWMRDSSNVFLYGAGLYSFFNTW
jgi:glucan 1,3-beta-glucosidase